MLQITAGEKQLKQNEKLLKAIIHSFILHNLIKTEMFQLQPSDPRLQIKKKTWNY